MYAYYILYADLVTLLYYLSFRKRKLDIHFSEALLNHMKAVIYVLTHLG